MSHSFRTEIVDAKGLVIIQADYATFDEAYKHWDDRVSNLPQDFFVVQSIRANDDTWLPSLSWSDTTGIVIHEAA